MYSNRSFVDIDDRIFDGSGIAPSVPQTQSYTREDVEKEGGDAASESSDAEYADDYQVVRGAAASLEAASLAMGWSRDATRQIISTIDKNVISHEPTTTNLELYDIVATATDDLGPKLDGADEYFSEIGDILSKTSDSVAFIGPIFSSPKFAKYAELEARDIKRRIAGPKVSPGLYPCIRCKSVRTRTLQKQTRRGDEGTGSINLCQNCGFEWAN